MNKLGKAHAACTDLLLVAADLIEFFGEEVIRRLLTGMRPGWQSDLRMSRNRHVNHGRADREPEISVRR